MFDYFSLSKLGWSKWKLSTKLTKTRFLLKNLLAIISNVVKLTEIVHKKNKKKREMPPEPLDLKSFLAPHESVVLP